MSIPRIRGTQIGLREPALVDSIKRDMQHNVYAFEKDRGRIGGIVDKRGTFHIIEGHHRMAAALELYRETGNDELVRRLLKWATGRK